MTGSIGGRTGPRLDRPLCPIPCAAGQVGLRTLGQGVSESTCGDRQALWAGCTINGFEQLRADGNDARSGIATCIAGAKSTKLRFQAAETWNTTKVRSGEGRFAQLMSSVGRTIFDLRRACGKSLVLRVTTKSALPDSAQRQKASSLESGEI